MSEPTRDTNPLRAFVRGAWILLVVQLTVALVVFGALTYASIQLNGILRETAEKQAELDKTLGRLGNLSAPERKLVEAMASSIVNKLIHNTLVTLKTEVTFSEGAAFVEAARRIFSLGDPARSHVNDHMSTESETCHSSQEDIQDVEEVIPRTGSKMPDQ